VAKGGKKASGKARAWQVRWPLQDKWQRCLGRRVADRISCFPYHSLIEFFGHRLAGIKPWLGLALWLALVEVVDLTLVKG